MSLWEMPREPLGVIGDRLPDGFIRADELLEFALPAVWGEDYAGAALDALPLGVEKSQKITAAVANGRSVRVAQCLKDALNSGRMLAWELRRHSRADWFPPQRIPVGDWSSVALHSIVFVLHTGRGSFLEQSMRGWNDDPAISFKVDEVEAWLKSLRPATSLPRLDELSSRELPYDNVSLSTALCWRAGQTAVHWFDVQSMGASIRDMAATIEEFSPEDSSKAEFDTLCYELADLLAAKLRRNRAGLELLKLMAEGHLPASGIRSPGSGDLEKINKDEFLVRREIEAFEDMLVPGKLDDSIEQNIALKQGTWKHVRFLSSDLIRASRASDTEPATRDTRTADKELPVRRPRMPAARAWAEEFKASWKAGARKLGREDTIAWLMLEFGLSREQARDIWGCLPQAARRGKGNPGRG